MAEGNGKWEREKGERRTCACVGLGEAEEVHGEGLVAVEGPVVRANNLYRHFVSPGPTQAVSRNNAESCPKQKYATLSDAIFCFFAGCSSVDMNGERVAAVENFNVWAWAWAWEGRVWYDVGVFVERQVRVVERWRFR